MRSYFLLLLFVTCYTTAQTTPCFTFDENEFVISGNATVINDDTIRLTEAIGNQAGFIWSQNLVNFEQDFNLEAELYLGSQDYGADGIAFVIQAISNNEGTLGGGIGYAGISPSLAIEFDTWWNSGNDPTEDDHVALIANGEPWVLSAHTAYIPYVSVNNLEDGLWHPILITWDGTDKILNLTLDGNLIFSTTLDIPSLFFNGNPNLYWGFTAATGGANNLQQVKILEFCSVDSSCDTPPPTLDTPQTYCLSTTLDQLQIDGTFIRFYAEETGDTLLEGNTLITENTTVYVTQTIDDCESQNLVSVEIQIENPTIYSDYFEIEYCEGNTSIDLYNTSSLFLSTDFSGFFNTQSDAENLTEIIPNPSDFIPTTENQMVFARMEDGVCYEVYPILLVSENCDLIIPQGISPNNDGLNDVFQIQNLYGIHLNHSLKIFNRYGICIFEGNNDRKWDGTSIEGDLVPVGTYFYVLKLNNDENDVFTGWVYTNY